MKKIALIAFLILPIYAFSIGPKHPDKIEPSIIHFELKPGQTIQDTIIVKNTKSDRTIEATFNAADSFYDKQNKLGFKLPDNEQSEFGLWTTLETTKLTLSPEESQEINYTITIPEETEQKDYIGGLTITVAGNNSENSAIKTNFRIVQTVKIKVTDNPQPIEKMDLTPKTRTNPYQIWFYSSIALTLIILTFIIGKKLKSKKSTKSHKSK